MNESTTLGSYLRLERESRGLTLRTISESTKVSVALLEGLEADDISRWPGGIFRRAFVRAYSQSVGLDPDDVFRRFETQYQAAGRSHARGSRGFAGPATIGPRHDPVGPWRDCGCSPGCSDRRTVSARANARHGRGSHRRGDSRVRLRCRRLEVAMAGPAHRGLLRNRCPVDGDQPHGGAAQRRVRDGANSTSSPRTGGSPTAGRAASERRLQPRRLTERPRARRDVQARAQ